MKKRIVYCLLVVCLGFSFSACDKEDDYLVIDTRTYSVQQSMLKFGWNICVPVNVKDESREPWETNGRGSILFRN